MATPAAPIIDYFRKQYPDSEEGALAFLRSDGGPALDIGPDAVSHVQADPWVRGVWRVVFTTPLDIDGPVAAIVVFLAGHPDPFGKPREYNDFDW